jgi:hypothetical protein
MTSLPDPSDFPRLNPELETAALELAGADEHGGRYCGQTQRAIDAGLSAATVESVRQGCYSGAQLSALIHDLGEDGPMEPPKHVVAELVAAGDDLAKLLGEISYKHVDSADWFEKVTAAVARWHDATELLREWAMTSLPEQSSSPAHVRGSQEWWDDCLEKDLATHVEMLAELRRISEHLANIVGLLWTKIP